MSEPKSGPPSFYGNVVQVTRTPWDITFYFNKAVVPKTVRGGETVDLAQMAEPVALVTVPLEVGKQLIRVLTTMTGDDVFEQVGEKNNAPR